MPTQPKKEQFKNIQDYNVAAYNYKKNKASSNPTNQQGKLNAEFLPWKKQKSKQYMPQPMQPKKDRMPQPTQPVRDRMPQLPNPKRPGRPLPSRPKKPVNSGDRYTPMPTRPVAPGKLDGGYTRLPSRLNKRRKYYNNKQSFTNF